MATDRLSARQTHRSPAHRCIRTQPESIVGIEQFRSHAVYVIHSDCVLRLSEKTVAEPGSSTVRLLELLDGRKVLAYHTDRRGLRRFARALRAGLERRV